MYYQKQILSISRDGHFLLAIHFARHKVGGEIIRESNQAYFAYGKLDDLENLKDITSLCCLPRPASKKEEQYWQTMAQHQQEFANECADQSTSQNHFLEYEWQFSYQSTLAKSDALYVPRTVLASLNGTLVLGIEKEDENGIGSAHLQFVDIFAEKILATYQAGPGPGAQALCHPHAMDSSGAFMLKTDNKGLFGGNIVFKQVSVPKLSVAATIKHANVMTYFIAANNQWIALDDAITLYEQGSGKLLQTLPMPKGVFGWTAASALDKPLIALAGDKGQICIVNYSNGEVKKYFPHRGCKRDDFAYCKLSADGEWMVSKIVRQKELMVTRIQDGTSWCLGELHDQVLDEKVEGEFVSQSHIPAAFAFIGETLLVSDSHRVRSLDYREAKDPASVFVSEQGKPGARKPISLPAKATLDKIVKTANLESVEAEISKYYSPAVKLKSKKSKNSGWSQPGKKGAPELGASRLGGWPDMPQGMEWPTWQDRPMSFLAQINLAEMHAVQPNLRLPKSGLLLFFMGCSDETYDNPRTKSETYMVDVMLGTEPDHKGAWQVLFAEENTSLERIHYPAQPGPDSFAPCLLSLSSGGLAIPDENSAAYENINFSSAEKDNYNEVIDLIRSDNWQHQLMGYPNLIQFTPPDMQCQLAASGKDPFKFPQEDTKEYKQLVQKASEWGLLLQLTSDDHPDFLWGDAGHLYFYGKREEMERGDFSKIWLSYECH